MPPRPRRTRRPAQPAVSPLRIIGGTLRGRHVGHQPDAGLRPMKDRVREALFNLIGPRVRGKLVLDLFAGTGAVAFEALSRGAEAALLVERRFPNLRVIQQSAADLGLTGRVTALAGDAFRWVERGLPEGPPAWLAVCCPPYEFLVSRQAEMLRLIQILAAAAPPGSLLVVESDGSFDPQLLPAAGSWDVRRYPPAVLALWEKPRE